MPNEKITKAVEEFLRKNGYGGLYTDDCGYPSYVSAGEWNADDFKNIITEAFK